MSFTTVQLAERVGGELRGAGDLAIDGVNALDDAGEREITFITDEPHAERWADARAGAAVITRGLAAEPDRRALIVVDDAAVAMVELLRLFEPAPPLPTPGVHSTAWVHHDATLGKGVRIGPFVSVEAGASVGDRVVLHAGARLYADAVIGDDSIVHANTVVRERCTIGRRVILHQNVSVGADGFGYVPNPDGSGILKVPQIGTVDVGDDVEIGAGTCIDRGKFGATMIGAGTKIDNLVQIGHNCRIGRSCIIVGLAGLAGSVVLEDGVTVAGGVGIADHVRVGAGAVIAAKAGVIADIPPGAHVVGQPAIPHREHIRQLVALRKLADRRGSA